MIRQRIVWTAALFNAFQMAAIYGVLYDLPIYFQAINDATPILSTVYIMPIFLPQLLTAGVAGAVCEVIKHMTTENVLTAECSAKGGICDPSGHICHCVSLTWKSLALDPSTKQLN